MPLAGRTHAHAPAPLPSHPPPLPRACRRYGLTQQRMGAASGAGLQGIDSLPLGLQQYITKLQEWAKPRIHQASAKAPRTAERTQYGVCPKMPHRESSSAAIDPFTFSAFALPRLLAPCVPCCRPTAADTFRAPSPLRRPRPQLCADRRRAAEDEASFRRHAGGPASKPPFSPPLNLPRTSSNLSPYSPP